MILKSIENLLVKIETAEQYGLSTISIEKPFGELKYELILVLEKLKEENEDCNTLHKI